MNNQPAPPANPAFQWLLSAMVTAGVTLLALGQWMLHSDTELARTAVWVEIFKGAPLTLFEWLHLALIQPWSSGFLVVLAYGHALVALIGVPAALWASGKHHGDVSGIGWGATMGYLSAVCFVLAVMTPGAAVPYLYLPLGLSLFMVVGGSMWSMRPMALTCSGASARGAVHGPF